MLDYGTNNGSVPASSASAGTALTGSGASGAQTGLFGLANYNPASVNNTGATINGANAFVQGANIPGQVAADMVPAEQAAAYGLTPQIDASAAASGNVNSSRDAIEHGIVATNLGQQANALATQLGANAFNTGANLTEQANQSNASNSLASLLGLTSGGTNAATAGVNANTGSVNQAGGLFNIAQQGASGQNNDPFQALQNFYNIIGSQSWGNQTNTSGTTNTTGTSTQTTDPSTMAQIGGWLNMAGSLF